MKCRLANELIYLACRFRSRLSELFVILEIVINWLLAILDRNENPADY